MKVKVVLLSLSLAVTCGAALGAQRAFVASYGNDANASSGCTLAAPCRAFQAAHTAVDPNGEIIALDTSGYGVVTITKSVTMMASPGVIAGITVSGTLGKGVTIATGGVNVILRGLAINNVGDVVNEGVVMTAGSSLNVENCVISNFAVGIDVATAARVKVLATTIRSDTGVFLKSGASAEVIGSQMLAKTPAFGFGILVQSDSVVTTSASVTDTVVSGGFIIGMQAAASVDSAVARLSCIRCTSSYNTWGFASGASAGGAARMMVSGSMASYNSTAGFANNGGTFESLGNNALHDNGTATTGVITVVSGN